MENTQLNQVLALLHVEPTDDSKLEVIKILFGLVESALLTLLNVEAVPQELNWIVSEVVVQRWTMLGSEGLTNESVESASFSYRDIHSLLDNYMGYINAYIRNNNPQASNKRMWMI